MDGRTRRWAIGAVAAAVLAAGCVPPGIAGTSDVARPAAVRLAPIQAAPDPAGGRFVDAAGRELILRGANVNALVDYWRYGAFETTFPFGPLDADLIAAQGWNVVRLAVSWSRIEPRPGVYDAAYLDEIARAIHVLASRSVYTLVDLHQDAWGATLAARLGEVCAAGTTPAFGWDGAPGWATLDAGAPRCVVAGLRETSPAVLTSFAAFWADAPGPGGIGIRTRYATMVGALARRFAREPAVIGYDLMNEPNAFGTAALDGLSALAGASLAEMRRNEREAGGFPHLLFVEPAPLWPAAPTVAPDFPRDRDVAFAPHLYRGGLDSGPIVAQFSRARTDATMYGGAPVLSGEWGSDPRRASDPADAYFATHQALQDQSRISATLWTWRESCGDPHKAGDARDGRVPYVWGVLEVDCTTNRVVGMRNDLLRALRRGYVRAAPGRLVAQVFFPETTVLAAVGTVSVPGVMLDAFVPAVAGGVRLVGTGLAELRAVPVPGGALIRARAVGGAWSLVAAPA